MVVCSVVAASCDARAPLSLRLTPSRRRRIARACRAAASAAQQQLFGGPERRPGAARSAW